MNSHFTTHGHNKWWVSVAREMWRVKMRMITRASSSMLSYPPGCFPLDFCTIIVFLLGWKVTHLNIAKQLNTVVCVKRTS